MVLKITTTTITTTTTNTEIVSPETHLVLSEPDRYPDEERSLSIGFLKKR